MRYFTSDVWLWGATQVGRRTPWVDVTVEEMRAYIGVCILLGIVVLQRIDMYWSQKLIQPIFQVKNRTHFEQISSTYICAIVKRERPARV